MPEKAKKESAEAAKTVKEKVKEVTFTCKFCGETKPFVDLVVMRQFYPPISCCKSCAKSTRNAPSESK